MHAQNEQHITLTQAAKIAPGRPSTNCMWRWCRKGVLARSGERIKLEHVRVGGKLFTSAAWVEAFGHRLAEADAAYFDRQPDEQEDEPPLPKPQPRLGSSRTERSAQTWVAEIERELEEAGL